MDKKKTAIGTALLASCSFAGYNIGSGFATGVEAQQFFASWGSPGAYIGLIVALITTTLVFIPVYIAGYKNRTDKGYNVYSYYCGKRFGKIIDIYMYFSILLIILTLMSGAGATVNQYFGIPRMAGACILGAMCIAAALLGLQRLMRILSYAGTVMIIFVLICTVYLRFVKGITVTVTPEEIAEYAANGDLKRISILGMSSPIVCGLASAGLLIVSSLPWVASTGALCESRKSAVMSGALSGIVFYIAQGIVVYLNLITLNDIAGEEIPVLAVFQRYLPVFAMLYSMIIILAIFSTVSGRLFLFADRFDKGNRKIHIVLTVGIVLIAALCGAYIPFAAISNFMFTVNGCVGILLGVVITVKTTVSVTHQKKLRSQGEEKEEQIKI